MKKREIRKQRALARQDRCFARLEPLVIALNQKEKKEPAFQICTLRYIQNDAVLTLAAGQSYNIPSEMQGGVSVMGFVLPKRESVDVSLRIFLRNIFKEKDFKYEVVYSDSEFTTHSKRSAFAELEFQKVGESETVEGVISIIRGEINCWRGKTPKRPSTCNTMIKAIPNKFLVPA